MRGRGGGGGGLRSLGVKCHSWIVYRVQVYCILFISSLVLHSQYILIHKYKNIT